MPSNRWGGSSKRQNPDTLADRGADVYGRADLPSNGKWVLVIDKTRTHRVGTDDGDPERDIGVSPTDRPLAGLWGARGLAV
jgi:hypothetical protein